MREDDRPDSVPPDYKMNAIVAALARSPADLGGLPQHRQIPAQQRALGEDGERVGRVPQRADDPRHQPVAALGALIRVGVRAQRDVRVVGNDAVVGLVVALA